MDDFEKLAERILKVEHSFKVLQDRFDVLQRVLMYKYKMRTTEDEPEPKHGLPRHYTGPDAQLIDQPPVELPNRYEQHEQRGRQE